MKQFSVPYLIESNIHFDFLRMQDQRARIQAQRSAKDYMDGIKSTKGLEGLCMNIPKAVLQNLNLKSQKNNKELVIRCIQLGYTKTADLNGVDARKLFLDIGDNVKEWTRLRFIIEAQATMVVNNGEGFSNFPPIIMEDGSYYSRILETKAFKNWLKG